MIFKRDIINYKLIILSGQKKYYWLSTDKSKFYVQFVHMATVSTGTSVGTSTLKFE